MDHAKINAVELGYEVLGSGEPMLFIHGSHIADALQPLVAEPALERFQRIRYHRRGLGGSIRPVEAAPTSVSARDAPTTPQPATNASVQAHSIIRISSAAGFRSGA